MNYLNKKKRVKRKLSHNEVILTHICNSYKKKQINQLTIYTNNEDSN